MAGQQDDPYTYTNVDIKIVHKSVSIIHKYLSII